jgi:DNA-binding IclR family transcriptional regulator
MARVQDHDLTRERIELQDAIDEIRSILNNGNVEFDVTAASAPAFDAPEETKLVFSIFGTQYRLYMSYLGDWYYTTMTKL